MHVEDGFLPKVHYNALFDGGKVMEFRVQLEWAELDERIIGRGCAVRQAEACVTSETLHT
jgi:hypothetical protein